MKDESMVEVLARAIHEQYLTMVDPACSWDGLELVDKELRMQEARACLQALLDHGPTKEMLIAGFQAFENAPLHNDDNSDLTPAFRAMIYKALGK